MGAFVWMIGALFSFCVMAVAARELSADISTAQTLFVRSVIGIIIVSSLIFRKGDLSLFRTQRISLHVGRGLCHFVGQYGWFVSIGILPLAQVFALEFTTPLWTLIIASIFLKESPTLKKAAAIVLGFGGVYLILDPGRDIIDPASLIMIVAAIFFSLTFVCSKALSRTEHPLTVLFFMCLIQAPIGLALGLKSFVVPNSMQCAWLLLVGVTSLTGHFCISSAMAKADASVVVTLDFLRLPLITAVGVIGYQEPFKPMLVVGAGLMLIGNLINIYPNRAASLLKTQRQEN
jgi:drug/metabolite transporter (DMT)-like permease